MNIAVETSWKSALAEEFEKPYFTNLSASLRQAYIDGTVYPSQEQIFNAFNLCPLDKVKVVILGQDPYHGEGQAHGLSFSVKDGVKIPPSLKNIYKEIKSDIGTEIPTSGNLERWAKQGVLLLNATLTVLPSKPGSHQGLGWDEFTDATIRIISEKREHVVFLLWGNFARSKAALVEKEKHLVLESPHPSPFSAHNGFFGCKHFSKTNTYLETHNQKPIIW